MSRMGKAIKYYKGCEDPSFTEKKAPREGLGCPRLLARPQGSWPSQPFPTLTNEMSSLGTAGDMLRIWEPGKGGTHPQ